MITKLFDADEAICHVTFSIRLSTGAREVSVVGDFNGWTPSLHALEPIGHGQFSTTLPLPAGQRYQFKYLCDHGNWHNDEAADAYQSNEYGQVNSVLVTARPGQSGKAPMTEPELVKKAPAKKAAKLPAPKADVPAKVAPAKKAAAPKAAAPKVAAPKAVPAKKAPAKKAAAKKTKQA